VYCSTCGVAVAQGLSYCKNCGARLSQDDREGKSSEVRPDLLVTAMVATFIFGLAVMGMLMGIMKVILGLHVEPILAFMTLPFLLMLVLEGIFIRLLLRRNKGAEETIALPKQIATNELEAAQARALPEGMVSVTEHTTRAFEPVYNRNRENK
jgi:hypothetical protein